jgi:hypothetical protein
MASRWRRRNPSRTDSGDACGSAARLSASRTALIQLHNVPLARLRGQFSELDAEVEGAPMLLAISDNGTEMRAGDTRKFMALCSIAQHFGRPSTPTDQAWIETLWGHAEYEYPLPAARKQAACGLGTAGSARVGGRWSGWRR